MLFRSHRWEAAIDQAAQTPDGEHVAGRFHNPIMRLLYNFAFELCYAPSRAGWLIFDGILENAGGEAALLDRIAVDIDQTSGFNLYVERDKDR